MLDSKYPLPWRHETDYKKMSAVVASDGCVVCGSLICEQTNAENVIKAHALIVECVHARRHTARTYCDLLFNETIR